ncbi:MAG: hypothetical protein ACJA0Z_000236 [Halioglobus sp.]|jgi:hypothetical protein
MSRVDSNSDDLQSANTHNFSYSVSYHNYPDTSSRSSGFTSWSVCSLPKRSGRTKRAVGYPRNVFCVLN